MIPVHVAKTLTIAVLFLTLFTNVTKWAFGAQGNLIVDFVFLVAIIIILQLDKIRYTKLVAFILAYIVLHASVQLIIHGGLLSGNNYTDYRNLVRGAMFFILLLNTAFRSTDQVNSFFRFIFVVVASVALLDIYAEAIAYHVLGLDLRSLPYVQAAYGEVETRYGAPEHRARIPTLLGSPHFLGLTQASLVFVFWHLYRHGYVPRALVYLTLISILFLSRLQVFVAFSVIFAYYFLRLGASLSRILLFLASAVAFGAVINEFGGALILTNNPEVRLAYDAFMAFGAWDPLLALIIFPNLEEWYKLVFGVGAVTGNEQYGNIISLAEIEVGLIVEMIPRYGFVFVVLYYMLLWRLFIGLRRAGYGVLAFALIPFMAAPLHMWLVNGTFVSDMFFVVVAYCSILVRVAKEEKAFSHRQGEHPLRGSVSRDYAVT